jgi:benzoylformate decarboxylase
MNIPYEGRHLFLDACLGEGANVMFGNPGTSELPIMDALNDRPEMRYVLCQHEAVAITAADSYAHLTGRVALVNLHIGPGLGNGIGSLYNAFERNTPMVVTCGQTDTRMRLREPMTSHDLVAMAKPVTEWAVQVENIEELPLIMARAFKTARERPGPVFVSLPMNIMDTQTDLRRMPPSPVSKALLPSNGALFRFEDLLRKAKSPAIIVGDRVTHTGAGEVVASLAVAIGAPVFFDCLPAHMNIPFAHSNYAERMPVRADLIRQKLQPFDTVVMIGGEFFEEAFYESGDLIPNGITVIQIDTHQERVARNFPVHLGLTGDIRAIVATLVERTMRPGAEEAQLKIGLAKAERLAEHSAQIESARSHGRLTPAVMLEIVSRNLPKEAHVSSELHLSTPYLHHTIGFSSPAQFLSARAGGIGQAFPSAVGAKIALPERKIVALSGDGSALYTPQALWTAAHLDLDITFVVLDNGTYDILNTGMTWYRGDRGISGNRPVLHFDLKKPRVDFVSLAQSFGVKAVLAETPITFEKALIEALAESSPRLIQARVTS